MLAAGAVSLAMVATAPSAGASASSSKAVTWAEQPAATPNFIFPFYPGSLCSVANVDQFQYLMYRPLYWYGVGTAFKLNTSLSVGQPPVYSNGNTTVTVTLKNWKWSDGETVSAQDVLFFMNIYHAQEANFCGYVPGNMPDDVKNVTAAGQTVTFTLSGSVNPYWWTYNEMSQITPLPSAWDVTGAGQAPGSGGCSTAAYGTDDTGCDAVYTYLSNAAGFNANNPSAANNSLATYATNPLWKVVDGPWTLSAFNPDGDASFVPNRQYSGPVKPTISKFTELPYTTDSSEFNALVGGDLTVGYLPFSDVTGVAPAPPGAGPNDQRLSNYTIAPVYLWGIDYFPYNFNSTGDGGVAGKIFDQLYFRQAMQSLVDQPLYVKKLWKGYAVPTYGPVPTYPTNAYSTKTVAANPLPYDPAKAKKLLSSNGWSIVPGGTDTCIKPGTGAGECGAGIPAGAKLSFTMGYATGISAFTNEVDAEKSSWSSVGINIALAGASFNTVISDATACPQGCGWEMENWEGGWTFSPDGYPSGDTLLGNGSAANFGSYGPSVPGFSINQSLITASITTNVSLAQWEDYVAKQAPIAWQPNPAGQIQEFVKGLTGVVPVDVLNSLEPENYRWSS
jgi:peptide/nickel transport system substrate-binding protein